MNDKTKFAAMVVVMLVATMALAGPGKGGKRRGSRCETGECSGRHERSDVGERGERQSPPSVEKILERSDANENGQIELDEAPERMKKRFEKMDADSDGAVNQEELQTAIDTMRERRGEHGGDRRAGGERGPRGEKGARGKKSGKPHKPEMRHRESEEGRRGKGRRGKGKPRSHRERPADESAE